MARIYAKPIGAGFDNTLILESREALVIPFDFSGGYNGVKLTAFVSLTSGTLNDAPFLATLDTNLNVNGLTRNRIYFGFMDRDGYPGESGCVFIGAATPSGDPVSRARTGQTSLVARWGGTNSTNLGLTLINPTGGCEEATSTRFNYQLSEGQYHSGSGNYMSIMGLELNFSNIGKSTQTCVGYSYYTNNLAPLTGYNELFNATFGAYSPSFSAAQTIGYAHSGVPLTIPKYVIITNPFAEHKLRIHSLGVFKVS